MTLDSLLRVKLKAETDRKINYHERREIPGATPHEFTLHKAFSFALS